MSRNHKEVTCDGGADVSVALLLILRSIDSLFSSSCFSFTFFSSAANFSMASRNGFSRSMSGLEGLDRNFWDVLVMLCVTYLQLLQVQQ